VYVVVVVIVEKTFSTIYNKIETKFNTVYNKIERYFYMCRHTQSKSA